MALQESTAVRNAKMNAIASVVGQSPWLLIFSGAKPVDCAAPDPAGLLVSIQFPPVWLTGAIFGTISVPQQVLGVASATGTAASWRLKNNSLTTCHLQGTMGVFGGAGDFAMDVLSVHTGQQVYVLPSLSFVAANT